MSKKPKTLESEEDEGEDTTPKLGTFLFPDGSKYDGYYQIVDDKKMRHGKGTFVNGPETYEGTWNNDLMEGPGICRFASGSSYEGEFQNNAFDGEGIYTWHDGAIYKGSWRNNKMNGIGCYTNKDNVKWEGEFCNGKYSDGRTYFALR